LRTESEPDSLAGFGNSTFYGSRGRGAEDSLGMSAYELPRVD